MAHSRKYFSGTTVDVYDNGKKDIFERHEFDSIFNY